MGEREGLELALSGTRFKLQYLPGVLGEMRGLDWPGKSVLVLKRMSNWGEQE